uniref:Uncharacterized protein n=1 Tax=Fagus sylvatica TaxID=28930 RepID=A0A2N9G8W6_FAGSY
MDAIDQAPSSQPAQTEVNTGMQPEYYYAAAKGSIQIFNRTVEPLDSLLTPNRNTILHIYLTALTKEPESTTTNFVKEILHKCPSLLWQPNAKDETPLHIAARYGHATIVKDLIECAESLDQQDLESGSNTNNANAVNKMLEMKNNEKDTALHKAVRNEHLEVVKLLIQKGPNFSYLANDAGETPLYIAVERNFKNLVSEILNTCTSLAHGGPLGRTTLHAAIIWDDEGNAYLFY